MSIRTERLKEAVHIIASEEILQFSREYDHDHGIIAVLDVRISPDKSYADIFVHAQNGNDQELTRFLAPIGNNIHARISREIGLRKTPKIRFRKEQKQAAKKDILQTIRELDKQYGLSE